MEEDKITAIVDSKFYNERSLNLLTLQELRAFARKFGIPHPTIMAKEDLINYILKVVYGDVKVPFKNSVGRPSKSKFNYDKVVERLEQNADISDELRAAPLGVMKVANFEDKSHIHEIETRFYLEEGNKCYLRVYQFVKSAKDYEISKKIANKLGLENNDVVEVIILDDMFKVISVNSKPVGCNFDGVEVGGSKLISGTKRDFYLGTKEEIEQNTGALLKYFSKQKAKLIIVGKNEYGEKGAISVTYDPAASAKENYKTLVSVIGVCDKAAIGGEDFLLVFENAEEIEEMIDAFDDGVGMRLRKYYENALQKYTALGNIIISLRCDSDKKY